MLRTVSGSLCEARTEPSDFAVRKWALGKGGEGGRKKVLGHYF